MDVNTSNNVTWKIPVFMIVESDGLSGNGNQFTPRTLCHRSIFKHIWPISITIPKNHIRCCGLGIRASGLLIREFPTQLEFRLAVFLLRFGGFLRARTLAFLTFTGAFVTFAGTFLTFTGAFARRGFFFACRT